MPHHSPVHALGNYDLLTGAIDVAPASNLPQAPGNAAVAVDAADVPLEGGVDPTFGTVQWRTLLGGATHAEREFVLGIAEFTPHGTLHPHRHSPAEFYLGLDGDGIVTIDNVPHRIAAGIAIYVPGDAEHGVVAGANGLRFAYGFAESAFANVSYRFSALAS